MQYPISVLGICPRINRIGWGVVDFNWNRVEHKGHDVIEHDNTDEIKRISDIHTGLSLVALKHILPYPARALAIELTHEGEDERTALKLSSIYGECTALLVAVWKFTEVYRYMPDQVSQSVTFVAGAGEDAIKDAVRQILHIPSDDKPNEAWESLAVALACLRDMLCSIIP